MGTSLGAVSITRDPAARLVRVARSLGESPHGNISDVPEADNGAGSEKTAADSGSPRESRPTWRSSLWLWPASAIGLVGIAGALFGANGALLVGGEALAALVVAAGILTVSRDRWQAIVMAAALTASVVVFVGLIQLHETHQKSSRPAPTATTASASKPPVDWQWRRISQAMAQEADLRGADLDGANMDGLQLSHKNFDGAQANGASLRGSQLEHSSFRGASLRDACLEGADLTGADLTGADFTGADVAGVTVSPQAKKAALVWPGAHTTPEAACT